MLTNLEVFVKLQEEMKQMVIALVIQNLWWSGYLRLERQQGRDFIGFLLVNSCCIL